MPYATYRFNKIIAAETIRFIVTVAIVVYKGLKLVVYRMLTAEAIDRNNRIAMVEMFSPATEAERGLLCKIFKVSRTDLVDISPERTHYYTDAVNRKHPIKYTL